VINDDLFVPQELAVHPPEGCRTPRSETVALLLMSQAPTLRVLSVHCSAIPAQYLQALPSLRVLTHLTVRVPHQLQCLYCRITHLPKQSCQKNT